MSYRQSIRTIAQVEALKKAREVHESHSNWVWLKNSIAVHISAECLIWPFAITGKTGYGACRYHGKQVMPHRLSFFFANGHWPNPQARHTCDVRACVNPRHIIEGTALQNHADMTARGRRPRGQKVHSSKLTEEIVRQIRADYSTHTQQELADKYGVVESNIGFIVRGETWKHML